MKKIMILLALVHAANINITIAQSDYYWSAGKKHFLQEMPNSYIVKFNDTISIQQIKSNIKNRNIMLYEIKDMLGIAYLPSGSHLTIKEINSFPEFQNVMPAYNFDNLPFYLTGEMLI